MSMTAPARVAACLALLVSCGGHRATQVSEPATAPLSAAPTAKAEPVVFKPMIVGVELIVSPPEAQVFIDDVLYGEASMLDAVISLEPGLHQLVIRHDGYKPYRVELAVSDKTETVAVSLEPAR
ncbi:MAG: hypothetical protein H6Q90_6555 [Deltaproteobacteria bacterium]|nr:hypothetical protein [Deltaproteobacteria bacterium]